MAIFPVQAFTKNDVNVAWKASYTSESLNKKFNGLPPGVYLGLTPASVPGSDILTLSVDATRGISVAAMKATGSNTTVHLQVENVVSLDFTGHVAYPVYVVAKASYAAGVTTSASIETQVAPPNGLDTVGICRVDAMGAVPVIASSAAPDRHEPLANTGVAFGFMRGGDIQNVDANNATTVDVNNAKVDTQSVVHPTLTARLAEDLSGAGLSKNLARTLEVIQGNEISIGAVGSANVSGSFAKFDRDVAPAINIATGGSESADGAVTSGSHPLGRNVVYLRDRNRHKIVHGAAGSNFGVYGRLSAATLALAGTLSFTAASTAVTGIGTSFLAECEVGDIIKGADNNYYEIASIIGDLGLTLSTAYQGATVAGATSDRRRFTVTFHYETGGVEGSYTFPSGTNSIVPFFPVFSSLNIARHQATLNAISGAVPRGMVNVDGTTPFTAAQGGVDGVAATDLATVGQTNMNLAKAPAYAFFNFSGNVVNTVPSRNTTVFSFLQGDQTSDAAFIASLTPPDPATAEVASIAPTGIITVNRPPAGLIYHVTLTALIRFDNAPSGNNRNEAFIIRSPTVSAISNPADMQQSGSPAANATVVASVIVAVDSGTTFGNVFEVVYQNIHNALEDPTAQSRLIISRVARKV